MQCERIEQAPLVFIIYELNIYTNIDQYVLHNLYLSDRIHHITIFAHINIIYVSYRLQVGFWVISFPLFFLNYHASSFGLIGLWISALIGCLVTTVMALVTVYNTDWDACILDARSRLGIVLED